MHKAFITLLILIYWAKNTYAQKDSIAVDNRNLQLKSADYDPLKPAKAAFFSAIFPGGGQIYNKKYWKTPIVWAAIGTSIYFYIDNTKAYNRYRTAFKLRKQGIKDEFILDDGTILISEEGLERAQTVLQRNKDTAMLVSILFYVLQIVEASVNAHLLQFDISDGLSMNPIITNEPVLSEKTKIGLAFKYSF